MDVTSIIATYAHLLVVVYARGDNGTLNVGLNLRFNNDSAANYDAQQVKGNAAAASATEAFAGTALTAGSFPSNLAGANLFGVNIVFIPHYAGTSNNKLCLSLSSFKQAVTTGSIFNQFTGGFWRSNAAINRVTLLPLSGNFVAGTRVTIYGMGA